MTTWEEIQDARNRLRVRWGSNISTRLMDAAEEGRTEGVYDRYLNPPRTLVEKNPEAWAMSIRWTPRQGSIYAFGSEGIGKSSMCRFLVAAWCAGGWPVMDLSATKIEHDLWKSEYRSNLKMAKRCLVLLVDDITNARLTPRGLDIFREIIDARHECGKATLITSQTSIKTLHAKISDVMGEQMYGTSLIRRFNPFREIEFRGESYRLNIGGKA